MNPVAQLILRLKEEDIQLWLDGDKLHYQAEQDLLSSELLAQIDTQKSEIVKFLKLRDSITSCAISSHISSAGEMEGILRRSKSSDRSSPLSFSQQRLWFLQQFEPDSPANHISIAIRLIGNLHVIALEQSLREIINRHQVFCTTFPMVDGKLIQSIADDVTFTLPIVNLDHLPPTQREAHARQLATVAAHQPFDLANGPIFRAILIRLSPTEHLLMWNMHRIICDPRSVELFYQKTIACYRARASDMIPNLPRNHRQYADFARSQRPWLQEELVMQQLDYWQQKLAGNFSPIQLPGIVSERMPHGDPSEKQTAIPARVTGLLPLALGQSLGELSQRWDSTLFVTLITAFNVLLYRYSGQEDILMSFASQGRDRPEIDRTIGLFANPLFLRSNLAGEPTFGELGDRVYATAIEAYRHQDVPFEQVVEAIEPDPDARSPLFQVKFALNPAASEGRGMAPVELPDLSIAYIPGYIDVSETRYDLTLIVEERVEGLAVEFAYKPDLFDPETIERMFGHYHTLLEGIVANPDRSITELPLLTAAEKQQQEEWNHTQADYPAKCIHQLFEEQVERTPDAVAIEFGDKKITYQELNTRSNQLAHYLTTLGVGANVLVGICVERSLDMFVGLLGILKAGGAYVPLDPTYPQERLDFMLSDSQLSFLVTSANFKSLLPAHSARLVCLDTDWQDIDRQPTKNPIANATPDDLAYIIYTSGSTGKPKGVQLAHQAVANLLTAMQIKPGLTDKDIFLGLTTISFDMAVPELYLPLIVGAKILLVKRQIATDGAALLELIEQSQVTIVQATPATWQMLLAVGWHQRLPIKILCGGEALSPKLAQLLLARASSVWNMYGPTEAAVWATALKLSESIDPHQSSISVGQPLGNIQVYILDRHQQPLPVGIVGELYIGGVCLAKGYLNRPELTAEKFITNPFTNVPTDRLYKTGDLARYLPDGSIDYLGRIDHQVKVSGFRIEVGEIELTLDQHPDVRQSVVVAQEFEPGDKVLIAYFVANSARVPVASELREFLQQKLPNYMVPRKILVVESFPITANGKVDRRALPHPDEIEQERTETLIAPRNEIEIQLTKIWQELFRTKLIGVQDNFFDLGGNSLLAVRIFAEIEKIYGQNLPLATLFQAQTIAALADAISQQQSTPSWSSLVPIQTTGSQPPVFCIHAVGGNILEYHKLAQYLGKDRPVYALQSQGLDGQQDPLTSVEEMARHYLQEIRSVQPEGGYSLVGYSFGGTIAYEMAQQLWQQGQRVDLLALLDTQAPKLIDLKPSIATQIKIHLTNLSHLDLAGKKQYIWDRIQYRTGTSPSYKSTLIEEFAKTNPLSPTYLKLLDNNLDANDRYIPQSYPGKVTLFRCQIQNIKVAVHQDLGWGNLAIGGLDIQPIPGHHMHLLKEPNVNAIAPKLQGYLPHTTGA